VPYGMNSGWSTYEQGMSEEIQRHSLISFEIKSGNSDFWRPIQEIFGYLTESIDCLLYRLVGSLYRHFKFPAYWANFSGECRDSAGPAPVSPVFGCIIKANS